MHLRKVRFRQPSRAMNLWSKLPFGAGTSYKRVAFVILSAVGLVMLFVLAGWNHATVHGVVILSPGRIFMEKYTSQTAKPRVSQCGPTTSDDLRQNSTERRFRKNYEVYVILDRNYTEHLRRNDAKADLLQSLLNVSDCQLLRLYHVHLVFHRNPSIDVEAFRREVNESARSLNDTMRLCERSGAVVKIDVVEIPEVGQEVPVVNRLMTDGYVFADVDYVSVSFAEDAGRTLPRAPLGSVFRALEGMSPKDVGAVFQEGASDSPSRFVFGRSHYEVFGVFLPPTLPDLRATASFFRHVYTRNRTVVMRDDGSAGEFSATAVSPPSTGEDVASYEAMLQRYVSASASNPCLRCPNRTSRMVIAMSLYGNDRRYTIGAIRNAQLLPVIFPGWRLWFYVERAQPDGTTKYGLVPAAVLDKLVDLGAELVPTDPVAVGLAPMLWRFTVMDCEDVDVFTVRDCDSRLTPRDAATVSDWLKTDRLFHCIRDHPSHSNFALSGGLWGARRKPLIGVVGNLRTAMQRYGAGYVEDMNFLGQDVWPKVKDIAYCHDSFSCRNFPSSHPFPVKRIGYEHIGQVYNELSVGRQGDIDILRGAGVNAACNPS